MAGFGSTDDAFHITQPSKGGTGALLAMKRAIYDARLNLSDIDYINAHGTSTPYNDKNESSAIMELFQKENKSIKVSSTKSMTGHLLGAAEVLRQLPQFKQSKKKFSLLQLIMRLLILSVH